MDTAKTEEKEKRPVFKMGSPWTWPEIVDWGDLEPYSRHHAWGNELVRRVDVRLPGSAQWLPYISEIYYDPDDPQIPRDFRSVADQILEEERDRMLREIADGRLR